MVRLIFVQVGIKCVRFDLHLYSSTDISQLNLHVYCWPFFFCCFDIECMGFVVFVSV